MTVMDFESFAEVADSCYTVDDAARVLGRKQRQVYNYAEQYRWRGKVVKGIRWFFKTDVEQTRLELETK